MGTVIDYLQWRGDLLFSQDVFNDVDALILAMLSYLPYQDIVPGIGSKKSISLKDTSDQFFNNNKPAEVKSTNINPTSDTSLDSDLIIMLRKTALSPRFANILLSRYEADTDFVAGRQFAALTYTLDNARNEKVIAFRGTDNSLVGWKEDFELAYKAEIPAQESARRYLDKVINVFSSPITVCGHSKGGNLAMYAASHIGGFRKRQLSKIINFDGPGFDFDIVPRTSFTDCEHRVVNYVPEQSIVGMLLEHVGTRNVISSAAHLINQHNALHWNIERTNFVEGKLSSTAKSIDQVLKTWLNEISISERETLVEALFDILGASEGAVLDPQENIKKILTKYSHLNENAKTLLSKVLASLTAQTRNTVTETIKEKLPKIIKAGN